MLIIYQWISVTFAAVFGCNATQNRALHDNLSCHCKFYECYISYCPDLFVEFLESLKVTYGDFSRFVQLCLTFISERFSSGLVAQGRQNGPFFELRLTSPHWFAHHAPSGKHLPGWLSLSWSGVPNFIPRMFNLGSVFP